MQQQRPPCVPYILLRRHSEITIRFRLLALSHPQRLTGARHLRRWYLDRMPASDPSEALALKASTLAAHHSVLWESRLGAKNGVLTPLCHQISKINTQHIFDALFFTGCPGQPVVCLS